MIMANENYRILDERDLNELEKEDKSLKEDVLKNEKSINDIKEDVVKLQGNVSDMSGSIGGIKDDIIGIEDNIADIEGDVGGIKERIDSINDEVDIVVSVGKAEAYPAENDDPDVKISPSEDGTKGKLDFEFYIPRGATGLTGDTGASIQSLDFKIATNGSIISYTAGSHGFTDHYAITCKRADNSTYLIPPEDPKTLSGEALQKYLEKCFKINNGAVGPQGDQGKSAYEVYESLVPDGEEIMSEEDWLESLKATPAPLYGIQFSNVTIGVENGTNGLLPPEGNNSAGCLFIPISLTDEQKSLIAKYSVFSVFLQIKQPILCNFNTCISFLPISVPLLDFFTKDTNGNLILNTSFKQNSTAYWYTANKGTEAVLFEISIRTYIKSDGTAETGIGLVFAGAADFNVITDEENGKILRPNKVDGEDEEGLSSLVAFLGGIYPKSAVSRTEDYVKDIISVDCLLTPDLINI